MSGSEDDAVAATVAASGAAPQRNSRELDSFMPGSTVGRYRLIARLGAGAMGVVWSARDPQLDREVAIKLVHPEISSEEAPRRLLLREARAMAKLSHRSVVTVYDAGDHDGTLFLAMELIHGTNLGQLLRERDAASGSGPESRGPGADWRRWLAMMLDAGRGLAEAHANGVLHRDFKPDNVLVDRAGRVCVGDFGLASLGEGIAGASRQMPAITDEELGDDVSSLEMTKPGTLLGTPLYMSPQQLCGEPIDARADQFAFCVATWEAVYGKRPFTVAARGAEALPQLLGSIIRGAPQPPASDVPDAVREALQRGFSVDPEARWPDIASLIAEIERATKRPTTVGPSMRRVRLWIAGLGVLAIIGIAVAIALVIRNRGDEAPAKVLRKERFSVPLRTRIALSDDGWRLAVATSRLEIYDTATMTSYRQQALPEPRAEVDTMHLEDGDLVFSFTNGAKRYRWRWATDESITVDRSDLQDWRATTVAGELVQPDRYTLVIRNGGREVARWTTRNPINVMDVSPDRRHVAYLDQDRFEGRLVVRDVTAPTKVYRLERLDEPTALAWEDATTLLVAATGAPRPGAATVTRLVRISLGEGGLGPPVEVSEIATAGWFGRLEAHGGRAFAIEMRPMSNGNLVERVPQPGGTWQVEQLGFERGGVPLAWIGTTPVAWNRETKRVLRYTGHSIEVTKVELQAEPANATLFGDVLIVALRQSGGRETVAYSLTDGRVLWRHADGRTLAVRCAGDRAAPCFAIRTSSDPARTPSSGSSDLEQQDRVFSIDPATGVLGETSIAEGNQRSIEDISVHPDGTRLVVVGFASTVRELDLSGKPLRTIQTNLSVIRSVAYDPTGGVLVGGVNNQARVSVGAGTVRTSYTVFWIPETGEPLAIGKEGDGILLLVRPSSDGTRVSYVSRPYEPMLVELALP